MSDLTMTCPACGFRASRVGVAALDREPCPYCGADLPRPKHCPTCTCPKEKR